MKVRDFVKNKVSKKAFTAYELINSGLSHKEAGKALDISSQMARKYHLQVQREIERIESDPEGIKGVYALSERARNKLASQGIRSRHDALAAYNSDISFRKIHEVGKVISDEIIGWLRSN